MIHKARAKRKNRKSLKELEKLITYCGFYCGCCARHRSFTEFRDAVHIIMELVLAHGFQHWMPEVVKEFDYPEFIKGLDFLSREDSWLICKRGCKGGDGRPDCEIRKCCTEHRIEICFDCKEFPCERIRKDKRILKNAREYKKLGKKEWLRKQVEMAKLGFEFHTGKFYKK